MPQSPLAQSLITKGILGIGFTPGGVIAWAGKEKKKNFKPEIPKRINLKKYFFGLGQDFIIVLNLTDIVGFFQAG